MTSVDAVWLHRNPDRFPTVFIACGSAPDLPIQNSWYDAVDTALVPRWPTHEITAKPLGAWELVAFAASCRNGLVTLFKTQQLGVETDIWTPKSLTCQGI
ncbi:hypothetical protein OG394_25000 [Kribbella sp. NBC_01245]|uniref:hypothetical protein n=1 Tax=Kribbella sp. NBC_01245 TaxID=2903578 RepID=UPI002E2BF342|nr:hypothetical protein [Kribbella sp. NBC_01245]